jgi:hypothetical protein
MVVSSPLALEHEQQDGHTAGDHEDHRHGHEAQNRLRRYSTTSK